MHPSPQSAFTGVAISESPTSVSVCGASSTCTTESSTSVAVCGAKSACTSDCSSFPSSDKVLHELLVFPNPVQKSNRARKAVNQKAIELSDFSVLKEMKEKEQAQADAKIIREVNKLERTKKAKVQQEEKERKKQERERKAIERQNKKEEKEKISKERKAKKQKVLHQAQ